MRGKEILLIGSVILLFINVSFSQKDSLSYQTDLYFITASQSFQPHWQVSNRYGIFDRSKKNEFVGLFSLAYQKEFGRRWKTETEVQFNLKSDVSSSYYQQIYLNLYYGSLQFKVGKEAYTLGQYSDDLSSGSLFVSNNSRPMPRIGLGFYDYSAFPFIDEYVEFKGAINFGILNDNRSKFSGVDKPLYHEKFFYLRSKSMPINIHAGLNHSALFGGTQSNGEKIPVDLWATLLGKSSGKVGGGEETNVAGAHFGVYDFGLNWKIRDAFFQFYYQAPFADDGGMKLFENQDQMTGILINLNKKGIITNINYEYVNTMWQGSHGVPDAKFDGKLVDLLKVEDPDAFMLEHFDTVTVGFTPHQLKKYSEDHLNYGYKYNGRDDLYNNYLYPVGQSHDHYAIGTSLMYSKSDMQNFNPNFDGSFDKFFVSNRIIAHHIAFDGYLGKNLQYRTKLTYSMNYGTHGGANKGRFGWGSMEDPDYYNAYYFKDGRKQAYTFFELNYTPFKNKGAKFSSSVAYDFGEMYHNFGVLFGFHYDGIFKLNKKTKP